MSPPAGSQAQERSAARRLLVAADCVTAAAVALLATDALRPGTGWLAPLLVLFVAIIPRMAAELIQNPRALFRKGRRLTPGAIVVAAVAVLAIPAGYHALGAFTSLASNAGLELVLFGMCWVAAFGLRDPATYVVYEPLALGAVLLSLVRGATFAAPLVAIAFLAVCVSGALRRQLADSTDPERAGRVNVRSAKLLGALAALLLVLVFALTSAGLSGVLTRGSGAAGSTSPAQPRPTKAPGRENSGQREDPQQDASQGGRSEKGDASEEDDAEPRRPADAPSDSPRTSGVATPSLRRGSSSVTAGDGPGELILQVTPSEEAPATMPGSMPEWHTLWRARTWLRFDAAKDGWVDEGRGDWFASNPEGRAVRWAAPEGRPVTTWHVSVQAQRLEPLLLPYVSRQILFGTDDAASDLRTNPRGDFMWGSAGRRPPPSYWVDLSPLSPSWAETAPGLKTAPAKSLLELEVPDAARARVDLRALAGKVIGRDAGALAVKLERLKAFFSASYRYAGIGDPRLADGLASLVNKSRVGSCQHLATLATLLLRASGVPARLATGYHGGTWDQRSGTYLVSSGGAHAWVEVSTTEGWVPLDPTEWVRALPLLEKDRGRSDASKSAERRTEPKVPGWLVVAVVAAALGVSLLALRRRPKPSVEDPEDEEPEAVAPPLTPPPEFVPRTPAEHLLVDYGRLQQDLATTGQERLGYETPREHARRVSTLDRAKVGEAFDDLVPMIDDGLYGHVDLTEDDLSRGREDIAAIKKSLA